MEVAILFARCDSVYKSLPKCDVYDIDRDARKWPGGSPVVAHPPCRAWGKLRQFAKPREDEKDLALFAVDQVRRFGGVLEHPAHSTLWPTVGLPMPGKKDAFGGWTLSVNQHWWGHLAEKATFLYVVGIAPREIPEIPFSLDSPTHIIGGNAMSKKKGYQHLSKSLREKTPPDFARWLVALASRCKPPDLYSPE